MFVVNTLRRRGAEQQLFSFVKELPSRLNISIFRFSSGADEFPGFFQYQRVKIHSNTHSGTYNALKCKPLLGCLSTRKQDVVVTLGLGAALCFGRICAIICGVKIIYSMLNTFENFHNLPKLPGDYFDILNKQLNFLIPRLPGKRVYRFLPNSNKLCSRIQDHIQRYPVQTLHNGLSSKEFGELAVHAPSEPVREILKKFEGYPTITQVGALDENKNQMFTLQCVRDIKQHVPNLRFLVIGDGYRKPQLMNWTLSNGLEKHVIFAGQLNRMDCLYLISKSSLLALTSKSESFPNVLLEAQAVSVPVVTLDVGAASDIIEDGRSGHLVKKDDRKTFKRNIMRLLKDEALAKNMGLRGKQRVLDQFTMHTKVEKLVSMIERDTYMI